jgi:DUF4097 and DUF4098 domain-containing protein YvlB
MKRMKLLSKAILMVMAAVGLFGLFGCDLEEMIQAAAGNVEAVSEVTETFALTGLLDLEVESSNGYVVVESTQTTSVTVVAKLRSRGDTLEEAEERLSAIQLEMTQVGNNVALRYRAAEQTEDVRRHSGVSFEVTVPMLADVEVDTSNGSITVRGIEGEFTLDTSNGSIDLSNLVGVVHADTSNGPIDVSGFAGILDLETSNGAIDIEGVEASVNARTSNGRIDFAGVLVGDRHELRTSNGAIKAQVPLTAAMTFDASTSIGSISTNLPLVGDTEGRSWNAALNPPATQTLELRTSNGSIRIEGL